MKTISVILKWIKNLFKEDTGIRDWEQDILGVF